MYNISYKHSKAKVHFEIVQLLLQDIHAVDSFASNTITIAVAFGLNAARSPKVFAAVAFAVAI